MNTLVLHSPQPWSTYHHDYPRSWGGVFVTWILWSYIRPNLGQRITMITLAPGGSVCYMNTLVLHSPQPWSTYHHDYPRSWGECLLHEYFGLTLAPTLINVSPWLPSLLGGSVCYMNTLVLHSPQPWSTYHHDYPRSWGGGGVFVTWILWSYTRPNLDQRITMITLAPGGEWRVMHLGMFVCLFLCLYTSVT